MSIILDPDGDMQKLVRPVRPPGELTWAPESRSSLPLYAMWRAMVRPLAAMMLLGGVAFGAGMWSGRLPVTKASDIGRQIGGQFEGATQEPGAAAGRAVAEPGAASPAGDILDVAANHAVPHVSVAFATGLPLLASAVGGASSAAVLAAFLLALGRRAPKRRRPAPRDEHAADLASLRSLLELSPIGIAQGDLDLRITEANHAFLDLTGSTRVAVSLGQLTLDSVTASGQRLADTARAELLAVGQYGPFRTEWSRPDGTRVPALLTIVLLSRSSARVACFVVGLPEPHALFPTHEQIEVSLGNEVAAQNAAQAGLAQAQRLQALGQLASGIVHDMNNVLQAVQAGLGLIRARSDDAARVEQLLAATEAAAARGAGITARLLTFAHRGEPSGELGASSVDLADLLGSLAEILRPTLGGDVLLAVHVQPGLPVVLADRGQLETVLVNLAINARDAIAEAGQPGTVRLVAARDGPFLRIEVADDGAGMSDATLIRATEPFFTTKPPGRGTGLGLAMARDFAEASGGRLAIRSQAGQGTTVSLWLPPVPAPDGPIPEQPVRPALIIVADDDPLVRGVLAEELCERCHRVEACDGAAAALGLMDAGVRADLLLTDLEMPGLNGLALIAAARAQLPGLPALLLTGHAHDLTRALPTGVQVLRKPVRGDALARAVAELLGGTANHSGVAK